MSVTLSNRHRIRRSFGQINPPIEIPNLLKIQLDSFERFLQRNVAPEQRDKRRGLEAVFRSVFPISDYSNSSTLEYVQYRLGEPKHTVEECRVRGVTYACPIRVALRLIVWEKEEGEEEVKQIRDIKEQDIYLGEIPLMTPTGSFIINGTERVIVSQMHKSPGVFFGHDKGKGHSSGKLLYNARLIPQRGSWLDFEFDAKDLLYSRIDRRRKFPATVLLRALGYTDEQLLKLFYPAETLDLSACEDLEAPVEEQTFYRLVDEQVTLDQKATQDILSESGEVLVRANQRIHRRNLNRLIKAGVSRLETNFNEIRGRFLARDVYADDQKIAECNSMVTGELIKRLLEKNVQQVALLYISPPTTAGPSFRDTLELDRSISPEQSLIELYKKMKPGDPPTLDAAQNMLQNFFFSEDRYSLSQVGRLKINEKLGGEEPLEKVVLTHRDILESVKYLLLLREGNAYTFIDDIDHLGNRRVRSVGELLETQFRIGLIRMERTIKERMSLQDAETMMLHDIVNAKPVAGAIHEFFGSSQLSQFMDQTNPLSEITHKRRLSALGPGGLTRERAGFDVRDVHSSHYGRICPIETPEGPNIGLIASLATYAQVNSYGFLETPYRKVEQGKITDSIEYLSATEEDRYKIAQANAVIDEGGSLANDFVTARVGSEFSMVAKDQIDYIDVSPIQLVSVAASLIPFLEHDDANRALMGSNMQRQGVPLVKPQAPLVGTGMEHQGALDSGTCTIAKRAGIVDSSDASRVVIQADVDLSSVDSIVPNNVDIYHLIKYRRSNQNTCINQRPLVKKGDYVKVGDIIADGASTENGELALGQNIRIAFMPWNGYNFEDSITVSRRLLHEDVYTSVHIDVLDTVARDTKLGKEEITRDIPNVSEEALRNLDESGIIRIGTYVRPGDILVGKVTPKGETQLNPEEKLLRAIFGEKAGDVRDTSLRVSQSMEGVVTDVIVFNREGVERDERTRQIEKDTLRRYEKDHQDEVRIIRKNLLDRVCSIASGQALGEDLRNMQGDVLVPAGTELIREAIEKVPFMRGAIDEMQMEDASTNNKVQTLIHNALQQKEMMDNVFEDRCEKLSKGDDLPPGVIRMVKVYVATKRKLSVGDKMAGRHGNKGVVSTVQPIENMPYMEDGTSVDIVLNPLGVPSRMNIGQVLETHLGRVASGLGGKIEEMLEKRQPVKKLREFINQIYESKVAQEHLGAMSDDEFLEFMKRYKVGVHMSTPVFDGATENDIHQMADLAELNHSGQVWLHDGLTGERFSQKVTVGYAYIMKLHHLVDEKIHARSIGPYSLVTQQPLGGKAQFGGQRFGEMEVWALEAYGAAHTLQELLTVKSDDVYGRNKIYEAIVKGRHQVESGLPESFKVLISELKSLCLNIELLQEADSDEEEANTESVSLSKKAAVSEET
jgi:DNA-directed RNA polymerase subunit beta